MEPAKNTFNSSVKCLEPYSEVSNFAIVELTNFGEKNFAS